LDTLHVDGGTRFAGHIIPTANEQYDIGSAAFKIRDMYVSDNSLWIGDEAKISFTGNQIKFRRRKKSVVPSGLTTLGAAHSKDAATVQSEALASASGVSIVADMKLHHWMAYAKSLDTTKTTGDIFTDSADDYEASAASEAFKEVGSDIYSAHNVSIGKSTAPTTALDVNGTVTATAFSGALSGSDISTGTVAAVRVATLNQNTTGSAATLTTARDIGGVSFNGSANINLPGVNTGGNQNTSGTAAKATKVQVTRDDTGDTSMYLTMTNNDTVGQQDLYMDTDLKYDNTSNTLFATTFSGALSGNATTAGYATSAGSATTATNQSGGTVSATTITSSGIITCNANKMVITGSSPTLYLRDSDSRTGMIHQNADRMYFLSGPANSDVWAKTVNDRWPLYLQTDTNQAVFGGDIDASAGTVSAAAFTGIQVSDVPTLNQNTSGSAASLTTSRTIFGQSFNGTDAVTGNLVFGTGATNKGTIAYPTDTVRTFTIPDTGAAANFVMTEGNQTIGGNKEFSSRIKLGTSASIRQSSTGTWTGDPGSGVGKLEYHSNRWYIVAGSNSTTLLQIRRNDTDKFTIDNNGSVSLGFVPWARLTGVQTLTRGSYLTGDNYNGGTARTWAVDATTDATVSKIVARDSGGDINARFVNGSYMNMSHSASDRNSDTIFYSSTDNYIRKTTASGMRSSLGLANSATITASASAGNSTIVQRHSSGYIFSNYINTTDNAVTSGVVSLMCKQSNDYHRSASVGAVSTFLGLGDYAYKGNGSNITRTSHSNGFLVGSYNSVGTNDAKTNPIYTIGSSFQPSDTSLSNMYGIGYSHGNFTSMLTGGWGLYVASDGNIRIGLNASHGHIKCTGYVDVGGVIGINGLDSNVPLTIQSNKTINVGGGTYTSYCRWYRGSGNWYTGSDNSTSWNQNLYWFANIATSGNPLAKVIMFENDQSKGTNINANTFTGQHRNIVKGVNPTNIGTRVGLIVSADNNENIKVNGGVERGLDAITINETIPYVSVTTKPYDKRVFGVISGSEDPESREDKFGRVTSVFIKEEGDDRIFINSLGEGAMWISNQNGPLESGDYVTSSNMPGYGMKQDSEFLANYTVAKITMNCDFQATLRVKYRIKTELKNVNYYRHEESFLKEYDYNKLEPDTQSKYSLEQYDENVNILDEYGQLQWEDSSETEAPYKVRYLLPDGTQISEEKYTTKAFANEEVYIAAFVGCTYHCG